LKNPTHVTIVSVGQYWLFFQSLSIHCKFWVPDAPYSTVG